MRCLCSVRRSVAELLGWLLLTPWALQVGHVVGGRPLRRAWYTLCPLQERNDQLQRALGVHKAKIISLEAVLEQHKSATEETSEMRQRHAGPCRSPPQHLCTDSGAAGGRMCACG